MKGDFSRDTFDRTRHFSAVRLQQGRVVTDADWNEQADLMRHRAERLARDTIGGCGVPLEAAGYALTAETHAHAVLALDASRAWIAAEDGALLTTADAGATWTLVALDRPAHLRALAAAGGIGWAVGEGGVVYVSPDGSTWTRREAGTPRTLRAVAAVDAQRAWAAGDGGLVIATGDGGGTWRAVQTHAARLYGLHFLDAFNGLAVGAAGVILRTSDGGKSWNDVPSGTAAHLRALARVDAAHAWAAGQDGIVVRSADAGVTWQPGTTPADTPTLHALFFRDVLEGWAVGEGGAVLHSMDGGASWLREDAGVTVALRGLSGVAGEPPWAVGEASTALRLADGSPPGALPVAMPAVNLSIGPGRCWVHGLMCELDARTSYVHQADGGIGARLAPGTHLLLLQAWERHVTALEQPALREVALGGPDTATRTQTVAQVRALAWPDTSPPTWGCDAPLAAWDALLQAPRPRLAARAEPQLATTNLCEIAATAGYRRLENQLYRVEVHEGGANPSFKWSRENGAVAYRVLDLRVDAGRNRTVVRVAARGRDSLLDLTPDDCLELIDEDTELTRRAGQMLEFVGDGDDELELVLAGMPTGTLGQDPTRHPVLRRWDQRGAAGSHVLPITPGTWVELEDGVQVRFEPGGTWRPGDYWQIAARTLTGDVEWPHDDDGDPLAREPAGVADTYCRLGIVEVDALGRLTVLSDCRQVFAPLTMQSMLLLYVSGDGQQGAPGSPVPQPLEARVVRGGQGVAGVALQVIVDQGGGTLAGGATAMTGADGVAAIGWQLGPNGAQRMRVELPGSQGTPAQRLAFNADLALPAQAAGAACEVTIGPGAQFERLDNELLQRLLERGRGHACICFLPGTHELERIELAGGPARRLTLHGCGPTAQLRLRGGIMLAGLEAVELSDLALTVEDEEVALVLQKHDEVRVSGVSIERQAASPRPGLLIGSVRTSVHLSDCRIRVARGVAAVLQDIDGDCHVLNNRIEGVLSFYGEPREDLTTQLIDRLRDAAGVQLEGGGGTLYCAGNHVARLTIADRIARQLLEDRRAGGLLGSAVLQGNAIQEQRSLFACAQLAFSANSFLAQPAGGGTPYGLMVAQRATASGNVAASMGDHAILHFVAPGGFRGAANMVFTLPQQ
jgi:photosystem II stability/assembly factor-like uncharacterized protein